MATIEERAYQAMISAKSMHYTDAYIQGATEQIPITKKEVIEKACEWLAEHFNITLKEFEDGGKFVEQLFTTEVEDAFRKAMEEQV